MKVFRNKDLADPRPLNASTEIVKERGNWLSGSFEGRLNKSAHCCRFHSEAVLSQPTGWMSVMVHTGGL